MAESHFLFSQENFLRCPKYAYTQALKPVIIMLKASTSEVATGVVPAKKSVLKNFAIFTGKNLCQSLFFKKVAGLRPGTCL